MRPAPGEPLQTVFTATAGGLAHFLREQCPAGARLEVRLPAAAQPGPESSGAVGAAPSGGSPHAKRRRAAEGAASDDAAAGAGGAGTPHGGERGAASAHRDAAPSAMQGRTARPLPLPDAPPVPDEQGVQAQQSAARRQRGLAAATAPVLAGPLASPAAAPPAPLRTTQQSAPAAGQALEDPGYFLVPRRFGQQRLSLSELQHELRADDVVHCVGAVRGRLRIAVHRVTLRLNEAGARFVLRPPPGGGHTLVVAANGLTLQGLELEGTHKVSTDGSHVVDVENGVEDLHMEGCRLRGAGKAVTRGASLRAASCALLA